jgi:uracil-DNA glycosylase family 4
MISNSERQAVFLDEIGVGPLWKRRGLPASVVPDDLPAAEPAQATHAAKVTEAAASAWSTDAMAVQPAYPRSEMRTAATSAPNPATSAMSWTQLKAAVSTCEQCGLCKKRTNTVFGVGDEKAKWLFIGEGPGRNEDAQGEPFVGPAGKLLDNMLLALGLKRGDNAYIANIVKCRPTDANGKDRPPTAEEADACMPYLQRQIALIQPTVIVALGKTAALSLLRRDPTTPVSALRGTVHRYADLPLIVTYHPAYLLRSPVDKRKTWADLCLAKKIFAGTPSGA